MDDEGPRTSRRRARRLDRLVFWVAPYAPMRWFEGGVQGGGVALVELNGWSRQ